VADVPNGPSLDFTPHYANLKKKFRQLGYRDRRYFFLFTGAKTLCWSWPPPYFRNSKSFSLRLTGTCKPPLQDKALVFFLPASLLCVISTSLRSLSFAIISQLLVTSFSFFFTCLAHPLAALRKRIMNLEYRLK
jgi:hypothetical protein